MIIATSVKKKSIVSILNEPTDKKFVLERRKKGNLEWEVFTSSGFQPYSKLDFNQETEAENANIGNESQNDNAEIENKDKETQIETGTEIENNKQENNTPLDNIGF